MATLYKQICVIMNVQQCTFFCKTLYAEELMVARSGAEMVSNLPIEGVPGPWYMLLNV